MTFTLTYQWWWIPTALTVGAVVWGFLPDDKRQRGIADGLAALFWAAPTLAFLVFAWVIAGVMK